MFCKNCGKQISDTDTFCPFCGQSINDHVQSIPAVFDKATTITQRAAKAILSKGVYTVLSVAASVLFILSLFMKWLEIPFINQVSSFFGGSSKAASYSILKLLVSLNGIYNYLPSPSQQLMVILVLVLTALLILAIWFFGKYIFGFFSKKVINTKLFRAGLICIIVLFAVCFIGMLIINSTISGATYGVYSEALTLTGIAYITGVSAIVSKILLVKKTEEEIHNKNKNTADTGNNVQ